jgi:hypothetical protein
MIKWFFIYKWLELKEFVQEYWIATSIISTALVSSVVWHIILTTSQLNQTTFQIACLSILLGVITMIVLAFGFTLMSWFKHIIKDNIEKARKAVSYDVSKLECDQCSGDIKIMSPRHSRQDPRFKCLSCGAVSDISHANRRQNGKNKQ